MKIKNIESLLIILYQLPQGEDFVVRGSFISRIWLAPIKRECQDLDLLYTKSYNLDFFIAIIKKIAEKLEITSFSYEEIWKHSPAPGVRFFLANGLQIDIGTGDPLVVAPVDLKISDNLTVKTVVPEIATAWKLHGLFEHIHGIWQSKTLWDLYLFLENIRLDKALLLQAIDKAFQSREDPIEIINRLFYGDFGQSKRSQKDWLDFIQDQPVQKSLTEVLKQVSKHLIPLLNIENDSTLLTQYTLSLYRIKLLKESNTVIAKQKLRSIEIKIRVLPYKAYNSISHLPGSRTGSADRTLDRERTLMLLSLPREPQDEVIVQEKLDGSCVSVANINGEIYALGKEGDLAYLSINPNRQLWAEWVEQEKQRFFKILQPGERIVGEWLAMAHGTRYQLQHEPFVAFDFFNKDNHQLSYDLLLEKIASAHFISPALLHRGTPCSIEKGLALLGQGFHHSIDPPEGLVWKLQRNKKIIFMAKYVRKDKVDGLYLTEKTGKDSIWNWKDG